MVTLKQRQYFELACPRCSSKDLVEGPAVLLRCCSCDRTHPPGDCTVQSVQTEIVEETEAGSVVLSGAAPLVPGRIYEIAETPMRCPCCDALGVEAVLETIGACFACYSAVAIEDLVIDSRDTVQSWIAIPLASRPGAPSLPLVTG